MRAVLPVLLGCLVCGVLLADPPADQEKAAKAKEATAEKPMSFWMEKKLDYAQSILRGLAMRDFDSIEVSARQMRALSRIEGFVRRKNPEYRAQLRTFERVSDEIIRQADRENLEGSTLAFNQLTVSCVSCHKSLRSQPEE